MEVLHVLQECVHMDGPSDHSTTQELSSSQLAHQMGIASANTYQTVSLAPLQQRESPTAEGLLDDNPWGVTSFVYPLLARCFSRSPLCGHMHKGVICLGQHLDREQ